MDDIPSYRAETRRIDALKPLKSVFRTKFQAFRPQTSAKAGQFCRISDTYPSDAGRIQRRLPSPRKSGREELVCGGLGKEETLHLMGFPSNALSINDTSGLREQLLKNLKSCESNTQHALDENSLIQRSRSLGVRPRRGGRKRVRGGR